MFISIQYPEEDDVELLAIDATVGCSDGCVRSALLPKVAYY